MRFVPRLLPVIATVLLAAGKAHGQALPTLCPRIPVPFGPGEEAIYDVKLGVIPAGDARLSVAALDTIRGRQSYRLELFLEAGVGFAKVRYDMKSWLDTNALVSRRHTRDVMELGTPRHRFYEIFPEERRWERTDNGEKGVTLHDCPQDEISFIYYLRSQPLGLGETRSLNRYFKEDGNPVTVQITGRDRIETEAGTFNTIVVRPTIRTSGLFREGGRAEVHLSDDANRDVVYMRIEMPVVGSVTLRLKELRRGTPLRR